MIFIHVWNFIKGYVIITVEGLKIERFINLLVANNIYVWDINRIDFTTVRLKINYSNVKNLHELTKRTDSSIHIEKKLGLPFILYNLRHKKVMITLSAILICMIYILTSKIWMIDITGLSKVDRNDVAKELAEIGLYEGMSKKDLDQRYVESKLLINMTDLSFVGIQIRGTKAIVECVERRKEPTIITRDEPCDIISDKDGVVSKMYVLNGDGLVTENDTIIKGQVLVSGVIKREGTEDRYVRAMAKIKARTWYEKAETIPLKQKEFFQTGRKKIFYQIKILHNFFLKDKPAPYVEYNKIVGEKYLFVFGSYVLPVKVIKTQYVELGSREKTHTIDEAKKKCFDRLMNSVRIEIDSDAEILSKTVEYLVDEDKVEGKVLVEVLENIGAEKPILK